MLGWLKSVLTRDLVFSIIEVIVVAGVIIAAVTVVLMARGSELPSKHADEMSAVICSAAPATVAFSLQK